MVSDKDLFKFNEMITTMDLYEEAKRLLIDYLGKNGRINAAGYRDLLNTNRKTAIALLEHFDMIKLTKRVENDRILLNLT
jgi:selenocysteine-specific elongation factor